MSLTDPVADFLTRIRNGIRARQAQLQELLAAEQPDVVCLQELTLSPYFATWTDSPLRRSANSCRRLPAL